MGGREGGVMIATNKVGAPRHKREPKNNPISPETWAKALESQSLVAYFAKSYRFSGLEMDDLIQEGLIGLCRAIDTYKPGSTKFGHWAKFHIKSAIKDGILRGARLIHVPNKESRLGVKFTQASDPDEKNIRGLSDRIDRLSQDDIKKIDFVLGVVKTMDPIDQLVFDSIIYSKRQIHGTEKKTGLSRTHIRNRKNRILRNLRNAAETLRETA